MLSIFQQVVGINAVLYFAPHMFENMGASTNQALWDSATSTVGITMTDLHPDRDVHRRQDRAQAAARRGRLHHGGGDARPRITSSISHLVSATVAAGAAAATGSSYVAIGAVVVYIMGFSFSWGPVVWVMLAEIFPNSIRGKAMSIAVAAQWIMNFVVSPPSR